MDRAGLRGYRARAGDLWVCPIRRRKRSPASEASLFPSCDRANESTHPSCRSRSLPRRAIAPGGSGSPSWSTRGRSFFVPSLFSAGGSSLPVAGAATSEQNASQTTARAVDMMRLHTETASGDSLLGDGQSIQIERRRLHGLRAAQDEQRGTTMRRMAPRRKKSAPTFPRLGRILPDEPEIGFMDQGRGLERLARRLLGELFCQVGSLPRRPMSIPIVRAGCMPWTSTRSRHS